MLFQNTISTQPYYRWLWKNKDNRQLFWFALAVMAVSFTWLKIIYPYPNFMPPDSYSYLRAAQDNLLINTWPIGYSKFLRLVSCFSQSHFLLVLLQYLLLQASVLYLLFTVRYLLSPGKWVFRLLFTLSITNPLMPHIANYISSDCLFAALSLVWFTQLLWILVQPDNKVLLAHAMVLLMAFTVRFTALYYPFISIAALVIGHMPRKSMRLGISSISFLLLAFISRTQYEYQEKTGWTQFSAFGSWQLAANALYGYAHSKPDDPITVPNKFRKLHTLVNRHMDSLRHLANRPDNEIGVYYLWDLKSPLREYMVDAWKKDSLASFFKIWASMAPFYQEYGRYLVMRHPLKFIQYYLWPNLIKYYSPPVYFMGKYNWEFKTVEPIAVSWFGWSNNQLPLRSKDRKIYITAIFPTILSIINPLFLLASISFVLFGGLNKVSSTSKRILSFMLLIWVTNMAFSVLSAPIELRYQLFPIIITITFCGLFINWIVHSLQTVPALKQPQQLIHAQESMP